MRITQQQLRGVIREEAQRILKERTEGVVEHDQRFKDMMKLLAGLMDEYQMDPKAIANLAARRIYEQLPKPPWVNDADAHTLMGDDEKKSSKPDQKKPEVGNNKKAPPQKEEVANALETVSAIRR